MSKQLKNSLLLLLTAVIWGVAFVAQSAGNEYVGPFTFSALRNVIGAIVLLPLAVRGKSESTKGLLKAGLLCGAALGVAGCLQQAGLIYTTAGKSGFITALYIIMIPIGQLLFMKQKCSVNVWVAVFAALLGVYLLCVKDGFSINRGDVLTFLCAIVFTVQILLISVWAPGLNPYRFACLEFTAAAVTSAIPALLTESVTLGAVIDCRWSLLYTGVLSSGVAYTLQIIAERDLNPAVAALIMSLESCIAAIAGWLLIEQGMSLRELTGCIIMFSAIILAQMKPIKT